MSRLFRLCAVAVPALALAAALRPAPPAPPVPAAEDAELLVLAAEAPELDFGRLMHLRAEGERVRAQLAEESDHDPGDELRRRLREVEVQEADAVAWFEANRALFGERSFAQSRDTVERIVAIETVQAELGLQ